MLGLYHFGFWILVFFLFLDIPACYKGWLYGEFKVIYLKIYGYSLSACVKYITGIS